MEQVTVLGGGLAGCEAAWALARRGIPVTLVRDDAQRFSPAHKSGDLAELICSNSLKAARVNSAAGLLKRRCAGWGPCCWDAPPSAPSPRGRTGGGPGGVLPAATQAIEGEPLITLRREEAADLPREGMVIVATGPLTSEALSEKILALCGGGLSFFDAAAPIVTRRA